MKKILCTVFCILFLLTLFGCGKSKANITITSETVAQIENNLAESNPYAYYKNFSNQPCTVSILIDSSTIGDDSPYTIDKNMIYGRIIKPYDDAMLGNCNFEYDSIKGGVITVSAQFENKTVKDLPYAPQKNDIVTLSGSLAQYNKPLTYKDIEASQFNKMVEVKNCNIIEQIPAEEVATAQKTYKEKEENRKEQEKEDEYQKNASTYIIAVTDVEDGILSDRIYGCTSDGKYVTVDVSNDDIKKIKEYNIVSVQGITNENSDIISNTRIQYIKTNPETPEETTAFSMAVEKIAQRTNVNIDKITLEQQQYIADTKAQIIEECGGDVLDIELTSDHILYIIVSNNWYNASETQQLDAAQAYQFYMEQFQSENPNEQYTMYIKDQQKNTIAGPVIPGGKIKLKQ